MPDGDCLLYPDAQRLSQATSTALKSRLGVLGYPGGTSIPNYVSSSGLSQQTGIPPD